MRRFKPYSISSIYLPNKQTHPSAPSLRPVCGRSRLPARQSVLFIALLALLCLSAACTRYGAWQAPQTGNLAMDPPNYMKCSYQEEITEIDSTCRKQCTAEKEALGINTSTVVYKIFDSCRNKCRQGTGSYRLRFDQRCNQAMARQIGWSYHPDIKWKFGWNQGLVGWRPLACNSE